MERYGKLVSLRQGESYQFIVAEGLNLNNMALNDIFNDALNEPVSNWEMGMLGFLSFCGFVGFAYNRGSEGGLPPLCPLPLYLNNSQVSSPLMTSSGRGGRNMPVSSVTYLDLAGQTAALPM